jgi:hypothetical protein
MNFYEFFYFFILLHKSYKRSSKPIVIKKPDYRGKLEIQGYDDDE